jgi:hypothetical protein
MIVEFTENAVNEQIDLLDSAIRPKITALEAETFEIRPAVSHGDIEIWMSGRMYFLKSYHFEKVDKKTGLDSYANMVIDRLRGKRFNFSAQNATYSIKNVLKEINYVLVNLCDSIFSEEEQKSIDHELDVILSALFNTDENKEDYS